MSAFYPEKQKNRGVTANVPTLRHCELLLFVLEGNGSRDSPVVSCWLLMVVMFVNLRGSGMCVGDVLAVVGT